MPPSSEQRLTLRSVLVDLLQQGVLQQQDLLRIEEHLTKSSTEREPWFVKLLLAVGAWVAAICFVSFLGIANLIGDESSSLFFWGTTLLVAATTIRNLAQHVFPVQLALALSTVGHGLALAAAATLTSGDGALAAVAAAAIILCLVLYPVYRDSLHRFLSCLLAAGCITVWIVSDEAWPLIHVEMLAKITAIGLVFMYRPDLQGLRPLGYAMAVSVPASLFLVLLPEDVFNAPWWPANVILAIALIWLYQWVVGGWAEMRSEPLILAVVATLGLASFTTPGILAALGLMVLGYARGDRYLLGMGVAFFPVFIIVFYYELQITLLVKSWIMAGSGAILLATRQFLHFRSWAREVDV